MCGRFTRRTSERDLATLFDCDPAAIVAPPRYNISPSQPVLAVLQPADAQRRILNWLHWGLIPSWADDPKIGYKMINARSETAATKPSFRSAMKQRRCLIPADGYYEWQAGSGKVKQPYMIRRRDGQPFAFAGLWENWHPDAADAIKSCTILTTAASEGLKPIHDRMPVILAPADYAAWLDPGMKDSQRVLPLLQSQTADALEAVRVSTLVNNPRNEDARCVEPI